MQTSLLSTTTIISAVKQDQNVFLLYPIGAEQRRLFQNRCAKPFKPPSTPRKPPAIPTGWLRTKPRSTTSPRASRQSSVSWWTGVENPHACPLNAPGLISVHLNSKKQKNRKSKPAALREESPAYHTDGNGAHRKLKFIDLFCGIGGFRIAFERADCECVFSSDWNEMAQIKEFTPAAWAKAKGKEKTFPKVT
jgi:hypothetical protein